MRDYAPLFRGGHVTHSAAASLSFKSNKARLTFIRHVRIWAGATWKSGGFCELDGLFLIFGCFRLSGFPVGGSLIAAGWGGGAGGGGQCVGVCVWGWGVSGMPDSGAVQNGGGGECLSFQTLRQEARQSPKRTHVEVR